MREGQVMLDVPNRTAAAAAHSSRLTITASDGTELGATLFEPATPAPAGAPLIIIGCAAGVPSRYYARFAAYLADRGHPVLTFDYREIGLSRRGSLQASRTRMRDWCTIDTPAVIDWAVRTYPSRPLHWIGHSMGGFATSLAHNNTAVARQLNIATLSGYWRRLTSPERYRVRLLMGMVAPIVVRAVGYLPGWMMGGEDMPGPAFLEWTRWCMDPEFMFGDATLAEVAYLAQFRAPIRFAQIEDDIWGTPAAVESIAGHFTANVERSIWTIRLADATTTRIGHHGFFREEFRGTLWPAAYEWLAGKG
jgi:predicted alpha/beta hydrolase